MIIKCVVFNDSKFIAGKYNNEKIGYKYLNGSGYYICEMLNNEYLWIKKYPYIINDFDVNDCGIYIIGNILVKYNNGISWKKKIDGKKISINNCNIYLLGNDNSIISFNINGELKWIKNYNLYINNIYVKDYIYILANKGIIKINSKGDKIATITSKGDNHCIAIDNNNNIYYGGYINEGDKIGCKVAYTSGAYIIKYNCKFSDLIIAEGDAIITSLEVIDCNRLFFSGKSYNNTIFNDTIIDSGYFTGIISDGKFTNIEKIK